MAAALKVADLPQAPSPRLGPAPPTRGRHAIAPLGLADEPKLQGLSAAAVGLYPWLLLLRQQWVIRGLSVLRGTSVEAVLAAEIPLPEIAAGLAELERVGLVLVDRAARVLYVPAGQSLTAQAPSNVRQVEQLAQQVACLPSSAVVERAKADLLALCERAEPARARHRGRQIVDKTLLERVREALGARLRSLPETEEQAGQLTLPGMAVVTEQTPDFIDYTLACEPVQPLREERRRNPSPNEPAAFLSILSGGQDASAAGADLGASADSGNRATEQGTACESTGAIGVYDRPERSGLRLVGAPGGADVRDRTAAPALPTFADAWRAAAERCARLKGHSRATSTGLSHPQEARAARAYLDHKLTPDDLLLVADYVNAGGYGWADSPRERVIADLAEAVSAARTWDAQGRPAIGKNKSRTPQNLKPSQGWES